MSFVQVNGAEISYSVCSPQEAKLAIEELKLLKKAFSLKKRELAAVMKGIRFQYSQEVRSRGSMIRGGSGLGRFIRTMQTLSRDSKRSNLASDLQPLESEKMRYDGLTMAADELLVRLELYLHNSIPQPVHMPAPEPYDDYWHDLPKLSLRSTNRDDA